MVGIVSDTPFPHAQRPLVDINDIDAVVDLLIERAEPLDHVLARVGIPAEPRWAVAPPVGS